MGGTFHSQGRGNAWRKDPQVEQQRQQEQERKSREYADRVVGRRVVVTSDIDYGRVGEIIDVNDSLELRVRLDGDPSPYWFRRDELQAAR